MFPCVEKMESDVKRHGDSPENPGDIQCDDHFVTAFKEYVFEGYDVGAFHYLLKPVDEAQVCGSDAARHVAA